MATALSGRPLSVFLDSGPARWSLRAVSIVICLIAWHFASAARLDLGIVSFRHVPKPGEVLDAGWDFAHSVKAVRHVEASIIRVFGGYLAAVLFGIGFGFAIGRSRRARDLLLPPLEVVRPIPAVAWVPLAVLMFPSTEASMIFVTFTGAVFPILLNTIHAVESIDPRLLAAARSLGSKGAATLLEVVLPGAAPGIVTGLSIGMGTSWFCLVSAEMIAGQFGIGYYTWEAYTLQNYADIVVGMLLIGVLGMGSSILLRQLGELLMPWQRAGKGTAP